MLEIHDLSVQFGGVRPLDQLDATLSAQICGLIGPNGAGKTTLLNVLSGFVVPISGAVLVDGHDILRLSPAARARFGLRRSFQTEQVVDDLSVFDNVLAVLDNLDVDRRDARDQVWDALDFTGLSAFAAELGDTLDLYQRRMVEIAKSLVGSPRLLMFDEPGAGMSEIESGRLRRCLLSIPERFGARILLIDHDVELISATCSQTLVLDFGRRLAIGETRSVLCNDAVRRAYLGVE